MNDISRYLAGVFELIGRAYRLDPVALAWVREQPFAIWLAIGVALLASISVMCGQAVVLLVNRMSGWKFAVGLLVSGTWLVLLHVVESVVLWELGNLFSKNGVDYVTVLSGVLVSMAPQIWGFLALMPYLGTAISRFLSAWSAVVLWAVTAGTFEVGRWPALGLVAASWLVMHLLSMVAAPWISAGLSTLFEKITGRPFWVSGVDVLNGRPLITEEVRA
ncbi:hypothetical protein [Micropruina sp.]|uniref:hypothetical protein n=1 Tax=Micropruina sp. TaxID=2737536 RepID=UPI0039E604DA